MWSAELDLAKLSTSSKALEHGEHGPDAENRAALHKLSASTAAKTHRATSLREHDAENGGVVKPPKHGAPAATKQNFGIFVDDECEPGARSGASVLDNTLLGSRGTGAGWAKLGSEHERRKENVGECTIE